MPYTLAVITQDGNVFGANVVEHGLEPVYQFSGAKIGFNPQDKFMVPIYDVPGGVIAVITQDGNLWS